MKTLQTHCSIVAALLVVGFATPPSRLATARAQETAPIMAGASSDQAGVPRLISFSGTLKDGTGKAVSGNVTLTVSLYEDQDGGSPLWTETETVQADSQGRYTVLLGATQPEGLPQDLFTSTRARWLGVAPALPAVGELPRVLLVGMPYALKASDADTLGGKPASDYVTRDVLSATTTQLAAQPLVASGPSGSSQNQVPPPGVSGTGKANYVPLWTNSTTLGNSTLFETSGKVGIGNTAPASTLDVTGGATVRGDLQLPATGTATATTGFNSQPSDWFASSFNSSTSAAVSEDFRWQAESASNNTASPSGTLNLLFGANGAMPAETGLSINSLGQITFAAGQTFPGAGNGTITGITAGTDLVGGGTAGNVTLNVDTTRVPQLNAANTFVGNQTVTGTVTATSFSGSGSGVTNVSAATLGGLPATAFAQLNAANTFAGNQLINGDLTATDLAATGSVSGSGGTFSGTYDLANVAVGFNITNVGDYNTAVGFEPLSANVSGYKNTALGASALYTNTTGYANTALGYGAGQSVTTGNSNTLLGYLANANPGGLSNATAIGAAATVSQSNSLVLGGTGTFAVNVGIGTSAPAYPLTLAADDNGSTRGGPHQFMIQGISNPNKQLLIGYLADSGGDLGYGAIQATFDGVANTPLALNPNGGQVIVAESAPVYSNPLQVGQGAGDVVADGYATYSSRRWKTNIKTLPDALNKVERLRGVSYDLKANGKHEVGVIAEEVGAVIPEIVEWDKNGKDANGVDYSRLTALLIEAVKQQQREIAQQNAMLRAQGATLRHLRAQVRDLNVKLTTAAHSGPSQPRLVAER